VDPYAGMNPKQHKLYELKQKMNAARKANENAIIAERKRQRVRRAGGRSGPSEVLGVLGCARVCVWTSWWHVPTTPSLALTPCLLPVPAHPDCQGRPRRGRRRGPEKVVRVAQEEEGGGAGGAGAGA
jgi:hypothetical protein